MAGSGWTTSNQAAHDSGVKILGYGESGMGKTLSCATMPRPFIISNESGMLSLKKQNIEKIYPPDVWGAWVCYDIPVYQVQTVEDLRAALGYAKNPTTLENFSSVCLDSASEMAEVMLSRKKISCKDPRAAYGEMASDIGAIFREFRDIDRMNVLLIAKQDKVKDEVTGITKNGPSFPGQMLGRDVPYLFDEVIQYGIAKNQDGSSSRYFRCQPDISNTAKDRSGMLAELESPHLGQLIAKIRSQQE